LPLKDLQNTPEKRASEEPFLPAVKANTQKMRMLQKPKAALQRMWAVFRRCCYYSYGECFFWKIVSVKLQNSDTLVHTRNSILWLPVRSQNWRFISSSKADCTEVNAASGCLKGQQSYSEKVRWSGWNWAEPANVHIWRARQATAYSGM